MVDEVLAAGQRQLTAEHGARSRLREVCARSIGEDADDRDAAGGRGEDMADPRVTAGGLLSVAGTGGENLRPFAAQYLWFMNRASPNWRRRRSSSRATTTNRR